MSGIARLFVSIYSTKMRLAIFAFKHNTYAGSACRPGPTSDRLRTTLIEAAKSRNVEAANQAVFELYGLNQEERAALGGNGL